MSNDNFKKVLAILGDEPALNDFKIKLQDYVDVIETYGTQIKKLEDQINTQNDLIEQISGRDIKTELKIKSLFKDKLDNVVVSINPDISKLAARMFEFLVDPSFQPQSNDDVLGVAFSGGRAIRNMVMNIQQRYERLKVFPLSCAGLPEDVAYSADTVIGMFCSKYPDAKIEGTTVPISLDAVTNILPKDRNIIFGEMRRNLNLVKYAFTGIGNIDANAAIVKIYLKYVLNPMIEDFIDALRKSHSTIRDVIVGSNPSKFVRNIIDREIDTKGSIQDAIAILEKYDGIQDAIDTLKEVGVVGDILYRGIDDNGNKLGILDDQIVGIDLDTLKASRNAGQLKIVGVASGANKAKSILAAIKGGYINVLVTDKAAALKIIEQSTGNQ